jgi:hypothetical protein
MIQSYAYDIIKQEGIREGIQIGELSRTRRAICDVLEARFELVPENVLDKINHIETIQSLEELLRKAVKVKDLPTFSQLIEQVLTPV